MKRFLCCLTAAVLLFGAVGCMETSPRPAAETGALDAAEPAPTDVIAFDDDVLEAWVRAAIGKTEGDITLADALEVTELELSQQGADPDQPYIHNLSALRYFPNLTYLGLGYAVQNAKDPALPVDLSPLAGLTRLESLQMGGLVIDDVSPLAGLTNLMSLSIFGGGALSDLSPLAGLTRLQALTLRGNRISDVSPLSGLNRLIYLDLEWNGISDVAPLAGLTGLTRLFLSNNPVTDYSPLAQVRSDLEDWDFDVQPQP